MDLIKHQQALQENIPYLADKMIIDFVNGLDAAKELNNKNLQASGFFARNLSLISGKSQQTQANINDHLMVGLEACQHYFKEVLQSQHGHANTIIEIDRRLEKLQLHTVTVANYVSDFKQQIEQQVNVLHTRLDKLESFNDAREQMDYMLSKLKAEKFSNLCLLGQCYTILDTLYLGDFGLYMRSYPSDSKNDKLLNTLENELIATFKQNCNIGAKEDLHQDDWLCLPNSRQESQALQHALEYQGDWSQHAPHEYPIVFMATQYNGLCEETKPKYKNINLNMIDISRVSKRMIGEMNQRSEYSGYQGFGL